MHNSTLKHGGLGLPPTDIFKAAFLKLLCRRGADSLLILTSLQVLRGADSTRVTKTVLKENGRCNWTTGGKCDVKEKQAIKE